MGAIIGATTEVAVMCMVFQDLARKHGIDCDFDFTDPNRPEVNFYNGTKEQHQALAIELEDKFSQYLD